MRNQWLARAIFLSWFTIVYNLIEGFVSIAFGVADESIALAGFGIDSLIEVASAVLILWRFRSGSEVDSERSMARERKATLGIGVLFLLLSAVIVAGSALQLRTGGHPITTVPAMIISAVSLSFMFWLWSSKRRVARELDSASMAKDAACSLACIKLSVILFIGSLAFAVWPNLWWVDSVAALGLAALIAREGWQTVEAARRPDFSGGCCCG